MKSLDRVRDSLQWNECMSTKISKQTSFDSLLRTLSLPIVSVN